MPSEELTHDELLEIIRGEVNQGVGPALRDALSSVAGDGGAVASLLSVRGTRGYHQAAAELEADYPIGRKLRALGMAALAGAPGNLDVAAREVERHWPADEARSAKGWLSRMKGLTAGNAAQAGDIVMPSYDPEWLLLLRSRTVVRRIARVFPMPRGATSKRRQTAGATAYYQGELGPMTESNLSVGRANLSYKKLTALSVVSNDLIRFSGGDADRIVEEDHLGAVATREDRAFLVGNPPVDAGSPQGIFYQLNAASHAFASAGASLANFQSDLTTAVQLVESSDVPVDFESGKWIMSPATFWLLYSLTESTGNQTFARELAGATPRLYGFEVLRTSALSVAKSWIGANAGMIFFVHGPSVEIHDSLQRATSIYPGGAYYDAATGAVASGISNDETVITTISEHDLLLGYDTAAAVITGYAT